MLHLSPAVWASCVFFSFHCFRPHHGWPAFHSCGHTPEVCHCSWAARPSPSAPLDRSPPSIVIYIVITLNSRRYLLNGSLLETEGSKSAEGIRGGGQEAPCVPPPARFVGASRTPSRAQVSGPINAVHVAGRRAPRKLLGPGVRWFEKCV